MKQLDPDHVVLLSNNLSQTLAGSIAKRLDLPVSPAIVERFSDGEVRVQIGTEVPIRNSWVFIIGSTPPPAENWVETWLLADAARRAAAEKVIWVAPYIGYGRQDRKIKGHDPISSKVFMSICERIIRYNQIIAIDLHSGQSQGFVDIPCSNLWGRKLVLRHILNRMGLSYNDGDISEELSRLAIGGPDPGAYKVTWHYAGKFNCILVGGLKTRPAPGQHEMVLVGGDKAKGRDVVILDDMSDTSGTLVEFARLLKEKGAKQIYAGFSHSVLSGSAIEKIEASEIDYVVTTDTIPPKRTSPKIEVITVADELAEAIYNVVNGESVSGLVDQL